MQQGQFGLDRSPAAVSPVTATAGTAGNLGKGLVDTSPGAVKPTADAAADTAVDAVDIDDSAGGTAETVRCAVLCQRKARRMFWMP